MKQNIIKRIENKNLFNKTEPIIVALSGGVDSMVLFDIIYKINKNIVIAHVNHNKRDESIHEYKYIQEMAKRYKVPFEGYTIEGKGKTNSNFHHDSRLQRYDFFRAVAQKHHSTKIAVAHHLDDQVETILMRIVRGTSFGGYSGIKQIRNDRNVSIIRPLMDIKKEEIITYSFEKNIKYFEDKSNNEDLYTRNRFRNNIIPILKEENPNLDSKIIQLAEYIDSADIVLEEIKVKFLKENSMYNNVSLEAFNNLNYIIKIKVIKHLVNSTTNNTVEVSYEQYKSIIELCHSELPNQLISLGNGYHFVKEYEVIYITKLAAMKRVNITVEKEGEYFVSDNKSFIFSTEKIEHNYSNSFELCYNGLVFPLTIRQRQNGDKMSLKVGTKKIKDILIDKKIPKVLRDRILLISNNEEIVWIPGIKESVQDQTKENKLYIYEVE